MRLTRRIRDILAGSILFVGLFPIIVLHMLSDAGILPGWVETPMHGAALLTLGAVLLWQAGILGVVLYYLITF